MPLLLPPGTRGDDGALPVPEQQPRQLTLRVDFAVTDPPCGIRFWGAFAHTHAQVRSQGAKCRKPLRGRQLKNSAGVPGLVKTSPLLVNLNGRLL